jgi:hypothetical protein
VRKNGPNDTKTPDPLRSIKNHATESIPCKSHFSGRAFPTKAPLNLIGGYSWSDARSLDPKLITKILRTEIGALTRVNCLRRPDPGRDRS